jgi:small subunit ribosomal protein S17
MEKSRERKGGTKAGIVVSDAMDKTVVVLVERRIPHPVYKRIVRRSAKFLCHDEENRCRKGDKVRIQESRPLSRRKRWQVREIIARAV